MALLDEVKNTLRIKNTAYDNEIISLIEACKMDLKLSGVNYEKTIMNPTEENPNPPPVMDPLIERAIKLYCKGSFGYDENSEKFMLAYSNLKDAMALSGDYQDGDAVV